LRHKAGRIIGREAHFQMGEALLVGFFVPDCPFAE
jgi:hypothetical protein